MGKNGEDIKVPMLVTVNLAYTIALRFKAVHGQAFINPMLNVNEHLNVLDAVYIYTCMDQNLYHPASNTVI